MNPLPKKKFGLRIRLACVVVSGIALWLVFRRVSIGSLATPLLRLKVGWFLAAVLLFVTALVLAAVRWHLMLRLTGLAVHAGATSRTVLIGHFFNTLLFGPTGGDFAKSALYSRWYGRPFADVLASSFLDRLLGLGGLVFFICLALSLAATNEGLVILNQVHLAVPRRWLVIGLSVSAVLGKEDLIVSDELNHASIIDGVRLCKAERFRYKHNDMNALEDYLKQTQHLRHRIIVSDGVFSMDGTIAQLDKICDLADQHDAIVLIDDSHSSGFLGKTGRGTHEYRGVMGRIDIITGTLGKALGGANGGFTSGRKEIIEMLRQRSRPYLFSNTLAPSIVGASIAVFDMLTETTELRDKLEYNTKYFRTKMN
jgi:hypothetical protein